MNDDKDKKTLCEKKDNFVSRIRKIKNIEVIVCIILIAVILLLYGVIREAKKKNDNSNPSETIQTIETNTTADELAKVLTSIKGAGQVKVFVSYDGTEETVYAYDNQKNTTVRTDNSGGSELTTTVTEESSVPVFVTVDGVKTPLISKTLSPKILGVIIVAEGAGDISIRLQLLRATATALDINENIIEIFIMK